MRILPAGERQLLVTVDQNLAALTVGLDQLLPPAVTLTSSESEPTSSCNRSPGERQLPTRVVHISAIEKPSFSPDTNGTGVNRHELEVAFSVRGAHIQIPV